MSRNSSLSVFFPCYNDSKTIGKLVKKTYSILPKIVKNYEVIVVDDYSKDNSRKLLLNLKKEFTDLKLVFHKKNKGYGGALQSGFKNSTKNLIFYTDGDGQYDVSELDILYKLMTRDVDFINGIKLVRHDPTYRIFLGNFYSFIARWLFFLPIYDIDCDFRLIRKKVIQNFKLRSNSGSICIELVKKAQITGAKFRQVSIHHYERKWGSSQFFRPSKLLYTFGEFIELWIKLILLKKY